MLIVATLAACTPDPGSPEPTTPTDSETGDVHILPRDSYTLPTDTAPDLPPNITPTHWVTLEQTGAWLLGNSTPPFGSMTGNLHLREYVDDLDTAEPVYDCDVEYALTGSELTQHTCSACDFVFEVEHYVQSGTPTDCHDPDVPLDGSIWNLGFDSGTKTIYRNYGGTGLWLPWYDATKQGATVNFEWTASLAIEVMDSGMM